MRWLSLYSLAIAVAVAIGLSVSVAPAWAGEAERYNNEGIAYFNNGNYDAAIASYKEAIRLKPSLYQVHYNLGIVYWMKGHNDSAIASYKEAVRLKPDSYQAHTNLGVSYKMKGQYDAAIASYREAIRLKPDYGAAHNDLAWLWVTSKDPAFRRPKEALVHAQRAVRLTGRKDGPVLNTLADVYYALGPAPVPSGRRRRRLNFPPMKPLSNSLSNG